MRRRAQTIGLVLLAPWFASCHVIAGTDDISFSPIVGSWQSTEPEPPQEPHRMTIFGDGTGEGAFRIPLTGGRATIGVTLLWEEVGSTDPPEFDVIVTCAGVICAQAVGEGIQTEFLVHCNHVPGDDLMQCPDTTGDIPLQELTFKRVDG